MGGETMGSEAVGVQTMGIEAMGLGFGRGEAEGFEVGRSTESYGRETPGR